MTTQQAAPASNGGQNRSAVRALESTCHNAWVVARQTGRSRIPTTIFSHFGTPAELGLRPREARNFFPAYGALSTLSSNWLKSTSLPSEEAALPCDSVVKPSGARSDQDFTWRRIWFVTLNSIFSP